MPYIMPTPAVMKAALPEFAEDDNTLLAAKLALAGMFVGVNWLEDDYQPAIIYLAAHYWALQKESVGGGGGSSSDDVDQDLYVKSVTFDDRTINFGSRREASGGGSSASSALEADLKRTTYGQIYLKLRRRNIATIAVLNDV